MFTDKDIGLYLKIANWDHLTALRIDTSIAKAWSKDEIFEYVNKEDIYENFLRNLPICTLKKSELKKLEKEGIVEKMILASVKIARIGKSIFFLNQKNFWTTDLDERDKLSYECLEDSKDYQKLLDFALYDERSLSAEYDTYKVNYIPVGLKYFNVAKCEMVNEAPPEFRTFSFNRNIYYKPVKFEDCKSKIVLDINRSFGADNFKYVLQNIAYNLCDNKTANRKALFLTGPTRSGKGTIVKLFKKIGIAPDRDLSSELSSNSGFFDMLAESVSTYPVVTADECEYADWDKLKKLCSDDTMGANRKGEKQITIPIRGIVILTGNSIRPPKRNLLGIRNKIVILKSQESYKSNIESNYWESIEKEGYDEIISLILTMAHDMQNSNWNPEMMPDSVKKTNTDLTNVYFYHDTFFSMWDHNEQYTTTCEKAYLAYLYSANPDVKELVQIGNKIPEYRANPKLPPKGFSGVSWNTFVSDCRLNNIKHKYINDEKVFIGKPVLIYEDMENTLDKYMEGL